MSNQPTAEESNRPSPRSEETIAEMFPDRGEFPGNDIRPDPDAAPAPNTAHPK